MVWTEVGRSRRARGRCKNDRSGDELKDKNDSRLGLGGGVGDSDKSMKMDFESGEEANGSMGWKRSVSSLLMATLVRVDWGMGLWILTMIWKY